MPKCNTELRSLTERDVHTIASGFLYLLRVSLDEEDAVYKFLEGYPSMSNLQEEHPMFCGTLIDFARGSSLALQQRVAKIKLTVLAGTSIMDLVTDILMITEFMRIGEDTYAWATFACVSLNLFFQVSRKGLRYIFNFSTFSPLHDHFDRCSRSSLGCRTRSIH